MNLSTASLVEILEAIKSGEVTQAQVWEHFDHISTELDDELQAYNFRTKEKPAATEGVLSGIPMAIKDLYSETGVPTTAASKMLENYVAPYESTVTKRLKAAGMISLGKVTCDEFAMGGSGENSALKVARNPWDTSRVPGGSSSGSAVAVASGMAPVSIGTDTGGSVRQPASLTGVVGFKGTYGSVSRYGVIPMASSLDTMGVLSRTVRDAHLVWDAMQGHDPLDATTLDGRIEVSPDIWNRKDLKWIKIGLPKEYFGEGIEAWTREVIEQAKKTLSDLGAELIEVSLPSTDYALAAYYVIVPSEVSSNLARFDGVRFGHITGEEFRDYADWISHTRSEGFGAEAKRRIMIGAFALSSGFYDAYYHRASLVRELVRREFAETFQKVDVLATPVSPMVAWKIGKMDNDPLASYMADIFTVPGALAGIPGLSVPAGYAAPADDATLSLPVGLQIMGPKLGEEKVLMVGHVFEQAMQEKINAQRPKVWK